MNLKEQSKKTFNHCKEWGVTRFHKFENVLRLLVLPGFKGMPLYDVLVFFLKSFTKGRLLDRAAAVAFNFFLALFPLILFAFTLIPYIPIPHLYERVLDTLYNYFLPSGTFDFVVETIDGIMNQPHEGLLSVSILLCLIFGSSGVSAIFNGFKNAYIDYGSYGWVKQRLNSLFLLFIIGALIFVSIVLISFGDRAVRWVTMPKIAKVEQLEVKTLNEITWDPNDFGCMPDTIAYHDMSIRANNPFLVNPLTNDSLLLAQMYNSGMVSDSAAASMDASDLSVAQKARMWLYWVLSVIRWLLAVFIIMISMSILYFLGNVPAERYTRKFRLFTPGSILATALFIFATMGFDVYIRNFSRYNALYGSIGALIILLMWLWMVAIVILCGNDLNVSIKLAADDAFDNPIVKEMKSYIDQRKQRLSSLFATNDVDLDTEKDEKKETESSKQDASQQPK